MEAKWGIIPDMGATVVLPELVPKARAPSPAVRA